MWKCHKCGRTFERINQQHSCKLIPLEEHFKNKPLAKELFDYLLTQIDKEIGPYTVISLPCCVHLFSSYDFLVALPHKDRLEIRFASDEKITTPRIVQSLNLSQKSVKFCINIKNTEDIDTQLLTWLRNSYFLKTLK